MPLRPALRAALVVSGLSVAACGGSQAASSEPVSNESSGNGSSTNGSTANGTDTATAACDPNVEPTTQACCETVGGRMWDATGGTCVWVAVPGPFVPPSMTG